MCMGTDTYFPGTLLSSAQLKVAFTGISQQSINPTSTYKVACNNTNVAGFINVAAHTKSIGGFNHIWLHM